MHGSDTTIYVDTHTLEYDIHVFLCCRPSCFNTALCRDKTHGICLFKQDPDIIKNCMYRTGLTDVRLCSEPSCHSKSTQHRKNYRVHIKTVYFRSRQSPCFFEIPCIRDMKEKRSGHISPTIPVVSTTLPLT